MALRPGDVSTLPLATEEPNGIRPQPRCLCSQSEHRSCSHEWGEKRRSTSRPGEWRGRCKSCHINWRELLRPDPRHFITINFYPIYCDGITYLCFLILFLTPESSRSWPLVLAVSGTEKDPCRGFVLCVLKARPASFYFRWPVSHALPLSLLGGSRTQQPRMHIQTNNHNSETPICQSSTETRLQNSPPVRGGAQKEDCGGVLLREMSHIMALLMFGTLHRVPTLTSNSLK